MNYYERHLGDYAKDTAHLSMLEHGAYTLLLDRYYSTEHGIPEDQVYRLARARSREERAAVDAVLAEFFKLENGVWINGRCEEEIPRALARIGAAQANGRKGGRPKKGEKQTQEKPSGFPLGSENETQPKAHQTPDTKHQSPPSVSTHTATSTGVACASPTEAGLICRAMKAEGVHDVNPGNADLLALIAAGAQQVEFIGAARTAASRSKGFAYAIGTLKRQREEAARAAATMPTGPMQASKQQARENRNAQVAASLAQRYSTEEHHAAE